MNTKTNFKEFNINKLKEIIKTGDYYSKDLQTKKIFLLRKKEIDEIRECFEFEDDCGFGTNKIGFEEKESGVMFVVGIIRDIIEGKKYEIIDSITKKTTQMEQRQ